MIPETSQNRSVELYRCKSFPDQWELERVLLEGVRATDATLVQVNDLWWMFVNMASEGVTHGWDELHLYYADRPDGDWRPHRLNPVKLDVRNSRPAGHLFNLDRRLFRPSQDCSERYGYAISINRIIQLDTSNYREEEVGKIRPRWKKNLIGTHTINSAEDLTVIDCLFKRRRFVLT